MTSSNINSTLSISWLAVVRKLQWIAVVICCYIVFVLIGFAYPLTFLTILYGARWAKICLIIYLIYMYCDSGVHLRGGRSWNWMQKIRDWTIWKYFANYFPVKLIKTADLDPSNNYLFCCHPHGLYGMGFGASFVVNGNGCVDLFPGIEFRLITLNLFFYIPFLRELAIVFGSCGRSKESIRNLLSSKPQVNRQSRAVVLLVGGAEEAFNTRWGEYRLVLKKRKGFVKIGLQSGTSLVPVFSFGETSYFNTVFGPEGSFEKKLEDKVRNYFMRKLELPMTRSSPGGITRNFFSLMPNRSPVHVVVGSPIKLPKIENPSQEQVDKYHQIYVEKLIELFDSYKNTYSQMYDCEELKLTLL